MAPASDWPGLPSPSVPDASTRYSGELRPPCSDVLTRCALSQTPHHCRGGGDTEGGSGVQHIWTVRLNLHTHFNHLLAKSSVALSTFMVSCDHRDCLVPNTFPPPRKRHHSHSAFGYPRPLATAHLCSMSEELPVLSVSHQRNQATRGLSGPVCQLRALRLARLPCRAERCSTAGRDRVCFCRQPAPRAGSSPPRPGVSCCLIAFWGGSRPTATEGLSLGRGRLM